MTLEVYGDGSLLIRELPLEETALLAVAAPLTEGCRQVLEALLAGRRVAMLAEAPEHRAYRRTAPRAVYQRFVAMERQIHALGVVKAGKEEGAC